MPTDPDVRNLERTLAAMQATLSHISTAVDRAEQRRDEQTERLANLETRMKHVEEALPEIRDNTRWHQKTSGWQQAKQDSESDGRARAAIAASFVSMLIALVALVRNFIWGSGP